MAPRPLSGSLPPLLKGHYWAGSAGQAVSPASRSSQDPPLPLRIMLRGECSSSVLTGSPPFPCGPCAAPSPASSQLPVQPLSPSSGSAAPELCSDPAVAVTPQPSRRIKSIVVAPPLAISGIDGQWTEVVHRRRRGASPEPRVAKQDLAGNRPDRPRGLNAGRPAPSTFLSRLCGRSAPLPVGRLPQLPPGRSPLPDAAAARFPPPPDVSSMPPLEPAMLHHVDPTRRPRESRSVAVPSPAVDQTIFFLRSHVVTLTAADSVNASSPMAVGRALEAQLAVPEHSLRVTAHHPEHYLVIFTQPAHQVNAVRRASIRVDGAAFNVASWHEHGHASFGNLLLHVRVVIEDVPMHFLSVERAEEILGRRVRVDRLDSRTLERGHTKTFACWVWTDDVGNIPTMHSLGVLPRGAGRVEEMM
ncbi:hypothetical protein ZWY2020_030066 [Hordeum vulgare]|nr:hypothetical protein ZWY2020_030066 [Hordeum vulgare]